jgi:hypothetical protein
MVKLPYCCLWIPCWTWAEEKVIANPRRKRSLG